MLDTGATVSTISKKFLESQLNNIPVIPVDEVLSVEVAGGSKLPFDGYVVLDFKVPFSDIMFTSLFLVVSATEYHETVPVLIGTNVLSMILSSDIQTQDMGTLPQSWSMALEVSRNREKWFHTHSGFIGLGKSQGKVTLQPNSQVVVDCNLDRDSCYAGAAVVDSCSSNELPPGVNVEPLLFYMIPNVSTFPVQLSNTSNQTVVLSLNAVCCEVQMARVSASPSVKKNVEETVLEFDWHGEDVDLSTEEVREVEKFLHSWIDVFSQNELDIGHTTAVHHEIRLIDDKPFKQRYRRIPPALIDEVRLHLQQLQDAGVIRPSSSPYASNLVLVRKKDNSLRICTDYRLLNSLTIKDAYALPRITEMFDYLGGSKIFSVLDMKSGYYQVPVKESDIFKSAFTAGPLGHFEYVRLPFGLTNSPATYQRLMEQVFKELNHKCVLIYLDDIIVFSSDVSQHKIHLSLVFEQLQKFNLKLAPKKCRFFRSRVKYLGHYVSHEGISVDPSKTEKVMTWPVPENHKQLHQFLGFAGYYRRFIRDYSKITKPLTELLGGSTSKKGKSQKSWCWGDEQQQAFSQIKTLLTSAPILGVVDPSLPYELHTDSSSHSLGAVLYQKVDGILKVIAFGSRSLKPAEQRYPTHKREFLALKWAITERFHEYLYGAKFTVFCDNSPLTYVLSTAQLDATGHRWLASLAAYDFDIKYKPGKCNADADGMSRIPVSYSKSLSSPVVHAICSMTNIPFVESLSLSIDVEDVVQNDFSPTQLRYWRQAQRDDPAIGPLFKFILEGRKPSKTEVPKCCYGLLKEFDRLRVSRGGMYRVVCTNGKEENRLVLPACLKDTVLHVLHDDMGHMGRDRTLALVQERFYWPGMFTDVEKYVTSCSRCIFRKAAGEKAPLTPIITSQPLEVVSMDFLSLEVSKGGFEHILVITDLFTRYAVCVPTKNLSAKTTALAFYNNFVVHYGFPGRIHSDQGGSFENKIIQELCKFTGMTKSRTSPYHPSGNGMTERYNSSLLNMLGTLDPSVKQEWHTRVSSLVHAYNCTPHSVTQVSPYFLMFGRHPNLPIDIVMGMTRNEDLVSSSIPQFVKNLKNSLKHAYEVAKCAADRGHEKQKDKYDLRARAAVLDIGDRVLVKRCHFTGKHKIADRWESVIYVVTGIPNKKIPVYVVKPENDATGKGSRTLHRNLLLPVGIMRMPTKVTPLVKSGQRVKSKVDAEESSSSEESSSADMELSCSQPAVRTRVVSDGNVSGPTDPSGSGSLVDSQSDSSQQSEGALVEDTEAAVEPRYPQRDRRPPRRFNDYVMAHSAKHKPSSHKVTAQSSRKPAHRKAKYSQLEKAETKVEVLSKLLDLFK